MPTRLEDIRELARFQLPVSGRSVALRHPSGAEDLLVAEAARTQGGDAGLALALASRLTHSVDGEWLDWDGMSITDLDVVVIRLRQAMIGDRVSADVPCPDVRCGRRIDVDFSLEQFLAHHSPRPARARDRAWTSEPGEDSGWFRLVSPQAPGPTDRGGSGTAEFRLPTTADLLAIVGRLAREEELAIRCLRPIDMPAKLRRRAEAAMEAMAPSLSGDLECRCPECGSKVGLQFDARWFCLRELRDRAAFIYNDVAILARLYHWSEAEILAMPHARRAAYVELAREEGGA